ncbi:MAG: cupredoxin domain-containing protein [Dehalococcoidia bacterium]
MRRREWIAAVIGVAALSLGVIATAACDDDKDAADTTPTDPSATEPADETDTPPTAVTPVGEQLQISADSLTSFDTDELAAPAGEPFTVTFDNQDTGIPHNWALYATEDDAGDPDLAIAATETEPAPDVQSVVVPALDPGEYYFQCDLHPNMNGTLTAQ